MRFMVDESKPADSIEHHWSQTTYDGQPGSWVIEIGDHWHKHHDEYMKVLEGRITFRLDGKEVVLTPADPPFHIARLRVHGFKFFEGERTTLKESTDPAGEFKEDFFNDIFEDGMPNFFTAMRAFYDGDTYVALPGAIKFLDQAVTIVLGGFAKWWHPRKRPALPSMGTSAENAADKVQPKL